MTAASATCTWCPEPATGTAIPVGVPRPGGMSFPSCGRPQHGQKHQPYAELPHVVGQIAGLRLVSSAGEAAVTVDAWSDGTLTWRNPQEGDI